MAVRGPHPSGGRDRRSRWGPSAPPCSTSSPMTTRGSGRSWASRRRSRGSPPERWSSGLLSSTRPSRPGSSTGCCSAASRSRSGSRWPCRRRSGRDGSWARAIRPRIAVPSALRTPFMAAVPCLVATWALGGLVLSLGPSLTAGVLGDTSHIAGGLPIFLMAGISALASVWLARVHARATARGGLVALIVGIALALAALQMARLALFLMGAAIAGLGFGPRSRARSARSPRWRHPTNGPRSCRRSSRSPIWRSACRP